MLSTHEASCVTCVTVEIDFDVIRCAIKPRPLRRGEDVNLGVPNLCHKNGTNQQKFTKTAISEIWELACGAASMVVRMRIFLQSVRLFL